MLFHIWRQHHEKLTRRIGALRLTGSSSLLGWRRECEHFTCLSGAMRPSSKWKERSSLSLCCIVAWGSLELLEPGSRWRNRYGPVKTQDDQPIQEEARKTLDM
ncbi:uncharacterized protein BJX67DRAFT_238837 [Aspergillus lucknowensis]|uniref:Uncharacterized protein n=1 Tax=Aspergillus lucknowensis TaxID=176173 RepID=A0ABR4LGH0_9EURO